MHTDEFIEYWAEIYQKFRINEYKLAFDTFLTNPEQYLMEILRFQAGGEVGKDKINTSCRTMRK